MKIDHITLTHVRIPLVEPFRISNGEITDKDGILVGVQTEGLTGYGESSPMAGAFYSEETPESTWECLVNELIPRVFRSRPSTIVEVNAVLNTVAGNTFAKAGIETAFWDLASQRQSLPLYRYLGGKRNQVEAGLAVGIVPTIDALIRSIESHLAVGYKRLKIKIQPGWDVGPLAAIRKAFGTIRLMVDANCAYTQADIGHLKSLDDFELMMIEQPLPKGDLDGHAKLQAVCTTPICLDEGAQDLPTVQKAIGLKSCRIVNIKIQRVGGLLNARRMHDLCAQAGIPVWGGTMPELGIGGIQTVHLATLDNFGYPTDVEASNRWFTAEVIDPEIEVHDGMIALPDVTGNGYPLNSGVIGRYKVREQKFRE
jgi:O-succinylbenzoate synthase